MWRRRKLVERRLGKRKVPKNNRWMLLGILGNIQNICQSFFKKGSFFIAPPLNHQQKQTFYSKEILTNYIGKMIGLNMMIVNYYRYNFCRFKISCPDALQLDMKRVLFMRRRTGKTSIMYQLIDQLIDHLIVHRKIDPCRCCTYHAMTRYSELSM